MPRTNLLGTAMQSMSALNGEPLPILAELSIPAETITERYAFGNETIRFHNQDYVPAALQINGLTEGSITNPKTLTVGVANIDDVPMGLVTNYWRPAADAPVWNVKLWLVPYSNPDVVAYADAINYRVVGWSTQTPERIVLFELRMQHVAVQKLFPNRSYTTSGGFPHLPPP